MVIFAVTVGRHGHQTSWWWSKLLWAKPRWRVRELVMSWCRSSSGGRTSIQEFQVTSENVWIVQVNSKKGTGDLYKCVTCPGQDNREWWAPWTSLTLYLAGAFSNTLLSKVLCLWLKLTPRLRMCNPHCERWRPSQIISGNPLLLPLHPLTIELVVSQLGLRCIPHQRTTSHVPVSVSLLPPLLSPSLAN